MRLNAEIHFYAAAFLASENKFVHLAFGQFDVRYAADAEINYERLQLQFSAPFD